MVGKKGYIYTLEVLMVISIVFVAIIFIYRAPPAKPELDLSIIRQQGYEALEYLDSKGELRTIVKSGDERGLEDRLDSILTKSIQFETEICTTSCSETNVPGQKPVVAVDYFISGYRDGYSTNKVRLWLWGKY